MTNNLEIGKKYLVTTNEWFTTPDGLQYKAAYGTFHGVSDSEYVLGVRTNARSTNWYVQLGNLTIAGCQVHYVVRTDTCETGTVRDYKTTDNGEIKSFLRPSMIYQADKVREEND